MIMGCPQNSLRRFQKRSIILFLFSITVVPTYIYHGNYSNFLSPWLPKYIFVRDVTVLLFFLEY